MADEAVVDATDSALDAAFDGTADTGGGTTSTDGATDAGNQTASAGEQQATEEAKGDERELAYLRNIKGTDPELYRKLSANHFRLKKYEGDLKDFDLSAAKPFIQERGGIDGWKTAVQDLETRANQLAAVEQAIQSGDGKIVEQMAELAGDNFAPIAQSVLAQMAQRFPEKYSESLMPVFAATVAQTQVTGLFSDQPTTLPNLIAEANAALRFAPPEQAKEIAQGIIARLGQFTASFSQRAGTAPTQGAQPGRQAQVDPARKELDDLKRSTFDEGYKAERENFRKSEVQGVVEKYLGRKLTAEDQEGLDATMVLVNNEINNRLGADKDYRQKLGTFEGRMDKSGAMQLLKSREGSILREVAEKKARLAFGRPVAPKAETKKAAPVRTSVVAGSKDSAFDRIWGSV